MATECSTFVAGSAYNRCDRSPHDAANFMTPPPRPHWSTITVAGHECELYAPPQPRSSRAVIYLHGVRERWLRELPGLRDQIEAAAVTYYAPMLCPQKSGQIRELVAALARAPER